MIDSSLVFWTALSVLALALFVGNDGCIMAGSVSTGATRVGSCKPVLTLYDRWKYQGLMAPDGLFIHFFGPVVGRRNDKKVLNCSGLRRMMRLRLRPNRDFIYADAGYRYGIAGLLRARQHVGGADARAAYRIMSRMRVSVEWGFGRVLNLWNSCGFKSWNRSLLTHPTKQYRASVLLTNIYLCLYPDRNEVSRYFGCDPPSVWDYLAMPPPTAANLAVYQQ